MKRTVLLLLAFMTLWVVQVNGQLSVDAVETDYTIDFDNTVTGVNEGQFDCSGFANTPATGQLDADAWAVIGVDDGDKDFGVESTQADLTWGTSSGGVVSGGLWAFEVETGNYALGLQPAGSDFTSGYIGFKIQNNTGGDINFIEFSYDVWELNNELRANSFNGEFSLNGTDWGPIPETDYTTVEAEDDPASWVKTEMVVTGFFGTTLANGDYIYFRWYTNDVSGSGSRDEIALDNITVNLSFKNLVTVFPFVEDFEDASPTRDDWTQIYETNSNDWTYQTGSSAGSISTAYEGTLNARFTSSSGPNITKLVSPFMDLSSSLSEPLLSFWYGQEDWYGDQNELKVYYRTDVSQPWVELAHYTDDIDTWTQEILVLPNPTSAYQIAFEGIDNYGYANVIDYVEVKENPVLSWYNLQHPATGNIMADETLTVYAQAWEDGVTNADVNNPGAGIECWIGYSDTESNPDTWTNWIAATYNHDDGNNDEFMAELGPLSAGTYYYASRWKYNGGSYTYGGFNGGAWDGSTNVSGVLTVNALPGTDCGTPIALQLPTALPYENLGATNCGLGDIYDDTDISNTSYDTGEDAIYEIEVISDVYVTITMDPDVTTYSSISLFDACPDTGGLIADDLGYDAAVREITVLLTTGTYYLMVDTYTAPDCIPSYDLTITEACGTPTNVEAVDLTSTTANIQWLAGGLESAWNIEVATASITPGTGAPELIFSGAATGNPHALSGLDPETPYYVYVQADCLGDWSTEYMFTTPAECPVPTGLEALVTGPNTATLTWDELGTTDWIIEVSTTPIVAPDDPDAVTSFIDNETVSGAVGTYDASGLDANTTYYWYVKSNCGSDWSAEGTFQTPCEAITLFPWTENFEGVSTPDLPDCWSENNNNADTDYWETSNGYGVSGSNAAELHTDFNGGNNDDYLILPSFVLTGNEQLRFSVRARSIGEPNDYRVVLSTSGTDPSDFTEELMPLTVVDWDVMTEVDPINLSAFAGPVYIAIHVPAGGLDGYYIYFDDFAVEEIPACPKPTALYEDGITSSSAWLHWTENGTAIVWNLKGSQTPIDPELAPGDYSTTVTNPFEVTGLDANTTYYWYVQADCGSEWSDQGEFSTECETYSSFPYTEEFEDAVPPECWNEVRAPSSSYGWISNTGGETGSCARFDSYNNLTDNESMLITPTFDLTSLSSAILEFSYKNPAGGDFEVLLSTDNGLTYPNTIASGLTGQTDWSNQQFDITSYIGSEVKIAFVGTSNYGWGDAYIYLDNFSLRALSDENDILTFTHPMQTGDATIDPVGYTVELEVANGTDISTLTPDITVSDYATINPLSGAAQDFTGSPVVYTVTAENGTPQAWDVTVTESMTLSSANDILTWSFPEEVGIAAIDNVAKTVEITVNWLADLNNLTPTITTSPLSTINPLSGVANDFSSSPVIYTVTAEDLTPQDWEITVTKEPTPIGATCSNPIAYTNINDPEVVTTINDFSRELWFTVTLDQTYVDVEFSTCASVYDTRLYVYDACEGTQLGYDDDAPDDYCSVDNNQSLIEMESLDAGTYYVLIVPYDNDEDISDPTTGLLVTGSDCGTPYDVVATNLTAFSADISWSTITAETGWNIEVATASITPGTGAPELIFSGAATGNPHDLSGLDPETPYYVYVQADCLSDWSTEYMFTTPAECPVPTGLEALVTGPNTATLTWDELGTTDWIIEVSTTPIVAPDDPDAVTSFIDNETVSGAVGTYDASGLDANTTYYWYVKSNCGSDWSVEGTFKTPCEAIALFPWTEDFEGVSTPDLPDCWSENNNNADTDYWETSNGYGVSDSNAAELHTDFNGGNNDDYLILPSFVLTGNEQLRFSVRARSTGEPNDYRVVLSTSGTDPSDFTEELMPLTVVDWTTMTEVDPIDLSPFAGPVYIAIHVPTGGLDGYYIYFDDFAVEEIPACPTPTGLYADNITTSSADLYWTQMGTNDTWNIKVNKDDPINPDITDGNIIANQSTMDNPFTDLTGLEQATTYYFYVQADCGTEWSDFGVFTTNCEAYSIPHFEGFEDVDMPICWSILNEDGDLNEWEIGDGDGDPYEGAQTASISFNASGNDDWLISPQFNISNINTVVDFYAMSRSSTFLEDFNVLISTTGTNTSDFTIVLENVIDHPDTWELHSYLLSDYGITVGQDIYVAIQSISVDEFNLYIDAFSIYELPEIDQIDINSDVVNVNVCEGDDEATAIAALAPQITITDTDAAEHVVNVTWAITSYDGLTPAVYNATGTFVLPDGVAQTDPETVLEVTATVTVNPIVDPTFTIETAYCEGDVADVLPTTSDNGITGTWADATIDTGILGDTDYIFTPDGGVCANPVTLTVTVTEVFTPTFSFGTVYCMGDTPDALPATSDNAIAGTWDIPTIATDVAGTFEYVFTPAITCDEEVTIEVIINDPSAPATFSFADEYCIGDTPDALPTISDNMITGTWAPATIATDVAVPADYTFTPDGGQCAIGTTITVTVSDYVDPTFTFETEYCLGDTPDALPTTSDNSISGTWSPDVISTASDGTADYTFTPDGAVCANPVTVTVTVNDNVDPTFTFETEYCLGDTPDALPTTSDNSISGTWSPDVISTASDGTADYIFTPDGAVCANPVTVTVTVNELPVVTCPAPMAMTSADSPVTLEGATPTGGEYTGTNVTAGEFDPTGLPIGPVTITYTYTDPVTGCENSCDFVIDIVTNIENTTLEGIGIYPNPNNGEFVINFNNIEGDVTYQLYDTKGSIIILKDLSANGNTVEEISVDLVPGVYYVKVVTAAQTFVEKLVVE